MRDVPDRIRAALTAAWSDSPATTALRLGAVMAVIMIAVVASTPRASGTTGGPAASLARLVEERHGVMLDAASVHWVDPPGTGIFNEWSVARAVAVGRTGEDALRDLYLIRARISPTGRALTARPVNLTSSFNAGDSAFVARGDELVLGIVVDGEYVALEAFDLSGEEESLTAGWPAIERLKNAVTNVQKTGQARGVDRIRYELLRPSATLGLAFEGGAVVASLDSGTLRLRPGEVEPLEGAQLVNARRAGKAMSGHVAWTVDTVRAVPTIGQEKIGWLEARFYRLKDVVTRAFYEVAGERYAARRLEEDLGLVEEDPYVLELPEQLGEMDVGWPPRPITPHPELDPLDREGKWSPFSDERFTRRDEGHPLPFYTSFIRPDPDRPYANLSFVAWDPRLVEIHMQAGVVEPISDTGKAGTGMIPRDDETMMRLLAAFNGGFQAMHGEFGMMQDGKVYLPPKPWAATVARLRGGRIGFGTWPGPDVGDIPAEILSYRQNLTPLMQDGDINPYRRTWWGSSPDLNPDSPKINRSGICWTEDGHILYALARAVDEYGFAEGFKRAGCHYLVQLDVNSGHSGFEFYRVDPTASAPPAGEEGLDGKSAAEGTVRDRPDLTFRARKLFKSMVLMRFPRFIKRDPRDYFYLTLARNLPGADLHPAGDGEGVSYRVDGLPGSTSYPPRFAMATLRGEEGFGDPVHVVQADPRWLFVKSTADAAPEATGAVWFPPGDLAGYGIGSSRSLVNGDLVVGFSHDPYGDEWAVTSGRWGEDLDHEDVQYAFRVVDEERALEGDPLCGAFGLGPHRFLTWAETPGGSPREIVDALHAAGVSQVLAVAMPEHGSCGWAFDYGPEREGEDGLIPLVDEQLASGEVRRWGLAMTVHDRDAAVRLFPDTEVVLPMVWNPGQIKRIRYFRPKDDEQDDDGGD